MSIKYEKTLENSEIQQNYAEYPNWIQYSLHLTVFKEHHLFNIRLAKITSPKCLWFSRHHQIPLIVTL